MFCFMSTKLKLSATEQLTDKAKIHNLGNFISTIIGITCIFSAYVIIQIANTIFGGNYG